MMAMGQKYETWLCSRRHTLWPWSEERRISFVDSMLRPEQQSIFGMSDSSWDRTYRSYFYSRTFFADNGEYVGLVPDVLAEAGDGEIDSPVYG
ncbi:hypothetical protein SAMN05660916_02390 [Arthrobacter sp. 31Cvi3.1E]|nr:hypothetical protein SAMN05660916_02390 [Arthrobacter sp. 31Cvi3.1E]